MFKKNQLLDVFKKIEKCPWANFVPIINSDQFYLKSARCLVKVKTAYGEEECDDYHIRMMKKRNDNDGWEFFCCYEHYTQVHGNDPGYYLREPSIYF